MNPSTEGLWKTFGDRLRRFIRTRVRNDHDADDVLQEAFAKIHAGLPGVNDSEKLEAWIFQVTRRAVVDHFRQRASKVRPSEIPADGSDPADVTAVVASWLRPMMEELPATDREILDLADAQGLGQQEIADRLGLSLTGAKSRVQRARGKLKQVLLDCCQVEMDRRGNPLSYTPRAAACSCESCG